MHSGVFADLVQSLFYDIDCGQPEILAKIDNPHPWQRAGLVTFEKNVFSGSLWCTSAGTPGRPPLRTQASTGCRLPDEGLQRSVQRFGPRLFRQSTVGTLEAVSAER